MSARFAGLRALRRSPALALRGGDLLALGAGLALPLAFAPFPTWWVALPSVGLLFALWLQATPARAAWRGWLYGVGAFGAGVTWIHESFRFSQVPGGLAEILTAGFVAFLALYPALAGFAARRLAPGGGLAALAVIFPAVWIVVEWLRGWLLTGFTWLQLGYGQVDGPLGSLLPVAGVYGTGLAVAVAAGLLAALWHARGRARALAPVLLLVVLGTGLGLEGRDWTRPSGEGLRVALVQGNVPQDEKWRPEMRELTLERYLRLTLAHRDHDLVVWPETALPGLLHQLEPFLGRLDDVARADGFEVLLGIPSQDPGTGRYLNSVLRLGGDGTGIYHKRHLVPFGEYLPLGALLRPLTEALGIPVADFSPGSPGQPLLEVAGQPVGISVCYEIAFGNEIRAGLPRAALLVTVSNDAWFGDSLGPHQHLQMARARALETGRWLLRATNTGISAVVAPDGRITARSPQFEVDVLTAEIEPRAGSTPYVRLGDGPVVVGLLIVLMVAGLGAVIPARSSARAPPAR